MNNPALPEGSWAWRVPETAFLPDDAARLRRMVGLAGRLTPPPQAPAGAR